MRINLLTLKKILPRLISEKQTKLKLFKVDEEMSTNCYNIKTCCFGICWTLRPRLLHSTPTPTQGHHQKRIVTWETHHPSTLAGSQQELIGTTQDDVRLSQRASEATLCFTLLKIHALFAFGLKSLNQKNTPGCNTLLNSSVETSQKSTH